MEILLEFIFQLVGEFLLQVLIELGLGRFLMRPRIHYAVYYAFLLFFAGACVGGFWSWLHPGGILPRVGALPLIVLFGSPLLAGAGMAALGRYRRTRGAKASPLATFYGGAAFSFGIALVRFVVSSRWDK